MEERDMEERDMEERDIDGECECRGSGRREIGVRERERVLQSVAGWYYSVTVDVVEMLHFYSIFISAHYFPSTKS